MSQKETIGVYLELFHGRKRRPDDNMEELNDWGDQGPILGPLRYSHTTYATDIKFALPDGKEGALRIMDEMLYYDGMYYGDWSVYATDLDGIAQNSRVQQLDFSKISPREYVVGCHNVLTNRNEDSFLSAGGHWSSTRSAQRFDTLDAAIVSFNGTNHTAQPGHKIYVARVRDEPSFLTGELTSDSISLAQGLENGGPPQTAPEAHFFQCCIEYEDEKAAESQGPRFNNLQQALGYAQALNDHYEHHLHNVHFTVNLYRRTLNDLCEFERCIYELRMGDMKTVYEIEDGQ